MVWRNGIRKNTKGLVSPCSLVPSTEMKMVTLETVMSLDESVHKQPQPVEHSTSSKVYPGAI